MSKSPSPQSKSPLTPLCKGGEGEGVKGNGITAELLAVLIKAKETIKEWHGKDGWEIYDRCSPEMKRINAAIAKAQAAEGGLGLELAKRILKLDGGTNIMSEKLCPICSHPNKHKKGCPYPLAEKLVKKCTGGTPMPPEEL